MLDIDKTVQVGEGRWAYTRTNHCSRVGAELLRVSFRYTIQGPTFDSVELDYEVDDDMWRLNVTQAFAGSEGSRLGGDVLNGAKVIAHMLEDAQGLIEFHNRDPECFLIALNIPVLKEQG